MAAYLTLARFKLLSTIPPAFVESVESVQSGYTDAQLEVWSRWIDSQLIKRYAVPFLDPVPTAVESWLARIVTVRVWTRRGVDPSDEQWAEVKGDDEAARKEIAEAANSETGLYELPLRQDPLLGSGVVHAFPKVYSEQSPYVWTTLQANRGIHEDGSGNGSVS